MPCLKASLRVIPPLAVAASFFFALATDAGAQTRAYRGDRLLRPVYAPGAYVPAAAYGYLPAQVYRCYPARLVVTDQVGFVAGYVPLGTCG